MRQRWLLLSGLLILGLTLVIITGIRISRPAIPDSIYSQLDFRAYYPQHLTDWKPDTNTVKFQRDGEVSILTYVLRGEKTPDVTISEQAVPGILSESQGYDFVVGKMNKYDELNTKSGVVALTRPTEFHGLQVGVARIGNTLVYAQAARDLDKSSWQQLFNSLAEVKQ